VKKWLLAKLILAYRWIRQTGWYYMMVVSAYIKSRLPTLDPEQQQRMYERSLLLKEFTVDVFYQCFMSILRSIKSCVRRIFDLFKSLRGKKGPAAERYAAPREDGSPPKRGVQEVFSGFFGRRRVAPNPERQDQPAG